MDTQNDGLEQILLPFEFSLLLVSMLNFWGVNRNNRHTVYILENMFEEKPILYTISTKNKYANIQDIIITNQFTKILIPPQKKQ